MWHSHRDGKLKKYADKLNNVRKAFSAAGKEVTAAKLSSAVGAGAFVGLGKTLEFTAHMMTTHPELMKIEAGAGETVTKYAGAAFGFIVIAAAKDYYDKGNKEYDKLETKRAAAEKRLASKNKKAKGLKK